MPSSASTDIAAATLAVALSRAASAATSAPSADMSCVPLRIASPSLAPEHERLEAGLAQRDEGRHDLSRPPPPAPRPISGSARCASGARSPEAPTEPCAGTTGWIPRRRKSSRRSATIGRAPEKPERERVRAQQQHRPHDLARQRLADARGVADEQVLLEPLGVGPVDRPIGERTEPGREPVDDRALVDERLDDGARPFHPRACRGVQHRLGAVARHRLDVADAEVGAGQDDALRGHVGG